MIAKAWEYAGDHPGETIDAYIENNPQENRRVALHRLEMVLGMVFVKERKMGLMIEDEWKASVQVLRDFEIVKDPVDTAKLYTNQFLS